MNKDNLTVLSDREITRRLLAYMKGHIGKFILVCVLMVLSVVLDVMALPWIIKLIFDELRNDEIVFKTILSYIILYGIVTVISFVVIYFQSLSLQRIGQEIMYQIREDVFIAIENLSLSQLNDIPVGKLVTRVTSDTNTLNEMYTSVIINFIKNILTIIVALIMMFIANVKITLLVLLTVPVLFGASLVFRFFSRKAHREVRGNISKINSFLAENLDGMKIIQVFNQEEKKFSEFTTDNKALEKSSFKEIWVFTIFRPFIYVIYMAALIIIVYFGANLCIDGVITFPVLILFQQLLSKLFGPIQVLADQFNIMQSAFAASERIFNVLDMRPVIVDNPLAKDIRHLKGDIEFKNVWFAYKDEDWVLKDVSFKIKAGETVAFVGATGSGKTTILSLIVRNYDINKGQILIDGIDIKNIKLKSLRRNIGQMLQDVFLFSGTIFSNIQMGDETVTEDEVRKASEYVNLHRFIDKLPLKYDEEVRERGNNFSNGQRQLLSFARTITYKPSIMILDEATANIDTETEVLIQDSLNKMRNIGTMLIVAHRLSTIQHADNIIVIKNGVKIEEGNHKELLGNKGYYYKLYQLQYERRE